MTDQNTGVIEDVADPVGQPEQNDQQVNWQAAQQTMAEQKAALEELRRQQEIKDQQLAVMQQYWSQQQQQQQQKASSPFDDLDESDVMTGADFKRVMSQALTQKETEFQQRLESTQQELKLMNMRSQHPDYDEAVGNAMKLAETNPELAAAIQSSSNPQLLAYQIGRQSMQSQTNHQQVNQAQKMVENAQKPAPASRASTGGSTLSEVDRIWDMSPSDFSKEISRLKGRG